MCHSNVIPEHLLFIYLLLGRRFRFLLLLRLSGFTRRFTVGGRGGGDGQPGARRGRVAAGRSRSRSWSAPLDPWLRCIRLDVLNLNGLVSVPGL